MKEKGVNLTSIAHNFKDWAMGEPMGIGETTYKVLILVDYPKSVIRKKLLVISNDRH